METPRSVTVTRASGVAKQYSDAARQRQETLDALHHMADAQAATYWLRHDGYVTQPAGRAAVDAGRRGVPIRAGGFGRTGVGIDQEQGGSGRDVSSEQSPAEA